MDHFQLRGSLDGREEGEHVEIKDYSRESLRECPGDADGMLSAHPSDHN